MLQQATDNCELPRTRK